MSDTPLLGLPYLAAAQAQKHVTHNEALTLIDGLVQAAVKSRGLAAPPPAPADGDRYLVAPSASGDWSGEEGNIAARMDGGWRFLPPREGWRLWVNDEDVLIAHDGTSWREIGAEPALLQNLTMLGVNATADAANKLSVASSAVLLSHAGAGHQLKINKAAQADTASLLFQTGFSGRAEMGTAGDDDFHVKVSADGSAFAEALTVQAATARVTARQVLQLAPRSSDPASPEDGDLWYSSASKAFRMRQDGVTRDLVPAAANASAALTADVALTASNVFYDGPVLTLGPGTWLLSANAQYVKTTSTGSQVTVRLTDGAAHFASQNAYHTSVANFTLCFSLGAVITLAVTTDVRLQMATSLGNAACLMKAAVPNNASGNTATMINAVRIQ